MSADELLIPALVAFLNAVQEDLKTPRYVEHPDFGRLRFVPMPAPLPALWFGHATPLEELEPSKMLLEVPSEGPEPNIMQEATGRALLRHWKSSYLPQMAELLGEVAVRLAAQQLAPLNPYDPAAIDLVQIRLSLQHEQADSAHGARLTRATLQRYGDLWTRDGARRRRRRPLHARVPSH